MQLSNGIFAFLTKDFKVLPHSFIILFKTIFMLQVPINVVLNLLELSFICCWISWRHVLITPYLSMRLPISKTKPAELMRTLPTCHVHAAFIFLYTYFATRTFLRILHHPITAQRIHLGTQVVSPFFLHFAHQRSMPQRTTPQTNYLPTVTHCIQLLKMLTLTN